MDTPVPRPVFSLQNAWNRELVTVARMAAKLLTPGVKLRACRLTRGLARRTVATGAGAAPTNAATLAAGSVGAAIAANRSVLANASRAGLLVTGLEHPFLAIRVVLGS
jgi:hypothetical protein